MTRVAGVEAGLRDSQIYSDSSYTNTAGVLYSEPFQPPLQPMDVPTGRTLFPSSFLLPLLAAIIGIPLYLLASGALKSSGDKLEDSIKNVDDEDALNLDGDKAKKSNKDNDAGLLDLDDVKSLGGVVGLAALVVLAFAVFPEDINAIISWAGEGLEVGPSMLWKGDSAEKASHLKTPVPGTQESFQSEKITSQRDGRIMVEKASQYTERSHEATHEPDRPTEVQASAQIADDSLITLCEYSFNHSPLSEWQGFGC